MGFKLDKPPYNLDGPAVYLNDFKEETLFLVEQTRTEPSL